MSTKRIALQHFTGTVEIVRASGTGPVRYGDTYVVRVVGAPEIDNGAARTVGTMTNLGQSRWELLVNGERVTASGGFTGTLVDAGVSLGVCAIQNARRAAAPRPLALPDTLATLRDLDGAADAYGTDGFYLDGFDLLAGEVDAVTADGAEVRLRVVVPSVNSRDAVVRLA